MTEIPRILHRIWLGGVEPNWQRELCRSSWLDLEGWTLREWNEETVGDLFPLENQGIYDLAPSLCPESVGQLRSDVLRYEILLHFGGVYVDADLERRGSLDELCELGCFAAWEDPGRWVNNAFMGASPGHPFIARLVTGLTPFVQAQGPGLRPNRLTGPHYLTDCYRQAADQLHVLPQEAVYPYSWRDVGRPDAIAARQSDRAIAVHHWANKRRALGLGAPV